MQNSEKPVLAAPFIREIARGKKGARDLSRDEARRVYAAMLNGELTDLEMGAFLIGMRIKGESVDEIAGFLDAAEASFEALGPLRACVRPSLFPAITAQGKCRTLRLYWRCCLLARACRCWFTVCWMIQEELPLQKL